MGSKTVYNAPKIEKDDSFEKYLEYQKERETKLEERAQQQREDDAAAELRRRQTGASGLTDLYQRTKGQLQSGSLNFQQAQNQLQSYIDKYDLTTGFKEGEAPDNLYTDTGKGPNQYLTALQDFYQAPGGLQETQRTAGIKLAYQDLLGRAATPEELSSGLQNIKDRAYGGSGVQGLRESIKVSSDYVKKFNQNYLDNYYDVAYGKQTVDEEGNRTGKRTFAFSKELLPTYSGDLKERTRVELPDYSQFFSQGRSIKELDEGIEGMRESRKFMYNAGLTNLQGEIDKETQKLKNEGAKDIARITKSGDMYKSLIGAFNF
tara:strand:+ start:621 stop:1577 length:957 start_codon:yes stop_codon:yes gene_type:complete